MLGRVGVTVISVGAVALTVISVGEVTIMDLDDMFIVIDIVYLNVLLLSPFRIKFPNKIVFPSNSLSMVVLGFIYLISYT